MRDNQKIPIIKYLHNVCLILKNISSKLHDGLGKSKLKGQTDEKLNFNG